MSFDKFLGPMQVYEGNETWRAIRGSVQGSKAFFAIDSQVAVNSIIRTAPGTTEWCVVEVTHYTAPEHMAHIEARVVLWEPITQAPLTPRKEGMTPIKEFWVIGSSVFMIDYADQMNAYADCVSPDIAERIALAEATFHGKQSMAFKPALRRMVPLAASGA